LEGFFMRSFEQMAQTAYARFCKAMQASYAAERDAVWAANMPVWGALTPKDQACWVEVAQQVAAEVAALH
jgi:hypothetical protein